MGEWLLLKSKLLLLYMKSLTCEGLRSPVDGSTKEAARDAPLWPEVSALDVSLQWRFVERRPTCADILRDWLRRLLGEGTDPHIS